MTYRKCVKIKNHITHIQYINLEQKSQFYYNIRLIIFHSPPKKKLIQTITAYLTFV